MPLAQTDAPSSGPRESLSLALAPAPADLPMAGTGDMGHALLAAPLAATLDMGAVDMVVVVAGTVVVIVVVAAAVAGPVQILQLGLQGTRWAHAVC